MNDDTGNGYTGKTVLLTGATGALGAGLAAAFRQAGADVIGVGRTAPSDPVDGVAYERADLTDDAQVAKLFDGMDTPWAVVNTVGGFAPHTRLTRLDTDELAVQLSVNLQTAAVITKHAMRVLQRAGTGRIVHTASQAATSPSGSGFAYSVSKLGVLQLVRMAAEEVAGTGITVNAVSPSLIDTPANRAAMPKADHGSWPKIADIANAYLFLAAPEALRVNGATVPV
jgi:NAD(P)-dependent dehydrogenase (short-subunit alcohol dehydrogenase family)